MISKLILIKHNNSNKLKKLVKKVMNFKKIYNKTRINVVIVKSLKKKNFKSNYKSPK